MFEVSKNLGKVSPIDLAGYALSNYGGMSHLKVQKLIYYAQAYHLAYFDEPLMDELFEAWVHGPVSRTLYNALKDISILHTEIEYEQGEGERHPNSIIEESLTEEQIELITDVFQELSTWKSSELEEASHSEKPWIEARIGYGPGDSCNVPINENTMRVFYKSKLNGQD